MRDSCDETDGKRALRARACAMARTGAAHGLALLLLATAMPLAAMQAAAPEVAAPSSAPSSMLERVEQLKPGEYLWAPEVAPAGPVTVIISLPNQRAIAYRNGIPIGVTTVSTGKPGHETPTGIFTILQKHVEHKSNLYDNAPMPYMQRLTWGGVALHAGNLPGYPASHGCVRLPKGFARLLYGVTRIGLTVVITNDAAVPRIAPAPDPLRPTASDIDDVAPAGAVVWRPDRAPQGPVSIVISTADQRMIVLRNGREIGSAPATIDTPLAGTAAYSLHAIDEGGRHWMRLPVPGDAASAGTEAASEEGSRLHVDNDFRRSVIGILAPGDTLLVTGDSLRQGQTGRKTTVLTDDEQ
jgi:hypothetical protein